MQEVRVTEYGKCYHVIGGTCSYCPPDRSTVVTFRMARDSMMLRARGACKVTDEVSRNMAPAGQIYEYDAHGKRNPQFPHKKDWSFKERSLIWAESVVADYCKTRVQGTLGQKVTGCVFGVSLLL